MLDLVNRESLRLAIRRMKRGGWLYLLLKEELSALGHWKNKPRGKPDAKNFEKGGKHE